jgi:hypothetical protein
VNTRILQTLSTAFFGACGIVASSPRKSSSGHQHGERDAALAVQILARGVAWRCDVQLDDARLHDGRHLRSAGRDDQLHALFRRRAVHGAAGPGRLAARSVGVLLICGIFAIAYGSCWPSRRSREHVVRS